MKERKERTKGYSDDYIYKRTDLERRLRKYRDELENLIDLEERELAQLDKKIEDLRYPLFFEEEDPNE